MSDISLINKLADFGLSEVEARIYVLLVRSEPMTMLEMAVELGVARTSVYDGVQRLVEKGLVGRVVLQKSQRVKAMPADFLEALIDREKERVEKLGQGLTEVKKMLAWPEELVTVNTQVRYYRGAVGLKQMMWNALGAKGETYGYSIMGRVEVVGERFTRKWVREFKARGLKDRVIVNPTRETLDYVRRRVVEAEEGIQLDLDEIKCLERDDLYVSGDTTIYNSTFALAYWKQGEVVGVEIDNPEFVRSQKTIFEMLWKRAKPVRRWLG